MGCLRRLDGSFYETAGNATRAEKNVIIPILASANLEYSLSSSKLK